jgi:GT2 family glycosyltransferase
VPAHRLGVVVIGRNEGLRLERCLASLRGLAAPVVYVDSGSLDGSLEVARKAGARVVELNPSRPFTAGRGRNEGFRTLLGEHPQVQVVQFLDGDCCLAAGWLDRAREALDSDPRTAIAAGRRRELQPEASVYNRLCDLEWATPVGLADECGGDFLARAEAFAGVQGFDERKVAGEEPDLCARLRAAGWRILRIDAEMTQHDADMHRFRQWWKRSLRAGHAAADNWSLVGIGGTRPKRRMALRAICWGLIVPGVGAGLALGAFSFGRPWLGMFGLVFPPLCWLALLARVLLRHRLVQGWSWRDASLYAGACVVGKVPEALGILRFALHRKLGRSGGLVEYKTLERDATSRTRV